MDLYSQSRARKSLSERPDIAHSSRAPDRTTAGLHTQRAINVLGSSMPDLLMSLDRDLQDLEQSSHVSTATVTLAAVIEQLFLTRHNPSPFNISELRQRIAKYLRR